MSLRLLRFARLVFSRYLQVCVHSIAWQPKTKVCTYVSACVQHNRLCAHMMGLTFKMYCNDTVEDDACSNCIGQNGIKISLSRALHLYGTPCGSGGWVVGGGVWWASLWEHVSPSIDSRTGVPLWSRVLWGMSCGN